MEPGKGRLGDEAPVGDEIVRHARLVSALARELARTTNEADDLVAATMAEAVIRRPNGGPGLRVWFGRVLARLALRGRRTDERRRRREGASDEAARALRSEEATIDVVARLELSRAVAAAFAELDLPSRQVLFLRFFDDLPPRTIATQLDLPVETVKTRIKRGLARLRERLDAGYGGGGGAAHGWSRVPAGSLERARVWGRSRRWPSAVAHCDETG
ncbi:MAG: sigma-70 family RNA polymerase sigma factor [Myxococcales bacterium]|nr:sigma-70 family RNA polymerase sigma factor [Myxococcales bacterium]